MNPKKGLQRNSHPPVVTEKDKKEQDTFDEKDDVRERAGM
jgi:hypothetical protein